MTQVTIKDLSKLYKGSERPALEKLSLQIASGELTALLGPSGCGKTTTMKMIAGLLDPTSGDVLFDGKSILLKKPEHRGVVMVFQNYLLFPYMSVAENIGFGLKMRKVDPVEIHRRVQDMLKLVKLPDLGERRPSELSGGQQQRIALARALIVEPDVLLLDEPLSNLDAHLRLEMRDLIRNLQRKLGITTIFVTHDQEEAVVLADKVALILDGRLKQYDRPESFYTKPIDEVTACFFGGKNFIKGRVSNGFFDCEFGSFNLTDTYEEGPAQLTIRPENVVINPDTDRNKFSATIASKIYMGTQTQLTFRAGSTDIHAVVNPAIAEDLNVGETIAISFPPKALWVF